MQYSAMPPLPSVDPYYLHLPKYRFSEDVAFDKVCYDCQYTTNVKLPVFVQCAG